MPLYLAIFEGDTPEETKPLIATRDRILIRLVTDELARRLVTTTEVAQDDDDPGWERSTP